MKHSSEAKNDKIINCSNISRTESIKQKDGSLSELINLENKASEIILENYKIWENYQFYSQRQNNLEKQLLKIKIEQTIDNIKTYLLNKNILTNPENKMAGDISTMGLDLFKQDLIKRVESGNFITQIPDYMRKFVSYISYIDKLDADKQKAFLFQFPPDNPEEYQCNDGAKSRLEAVFSSAKPSSIIVNCHDASAEDIAINFRKSVNESNHPHVEAYVNYLLGINKGLIRKIDNFYSTPKNQVSTKQVYQAITSYDNLLEKHYLNALNSNKEKLINEIVQITQEDNSNQGYRYREVERLIKDGLDIEDKEAEELRIILSKESTEDDKSCFWLRKEKKISKDIIKETKDEEENIIDVLMTQIEGVIKRKENYFESIKTKSEDEQFQNLSPETLKLENIHILIEASKGLLKQKATLNNREKSTIYALRTLAESLQDNSDGAGSISFLIASDNLVGNKDLLLERVKEDCVLTRYINRIFEVREIYLGDENTKVETQYPLFYKILTNDERSINSSIEGKDFINPLEEEFYPKNQPDLKVSALELSLKTDSSNLIKLLVKKIPHQIKIESFFDRYKDNNPLITAINEQRIGTVKAFLDLALDHNLSEENQEFFKSLISKKDSNHRNALMIAIRRGETEIVKAFLNASLDSIEHNSELFKSIIIKGENNFGQNALMIAASQGETEIVKAFLDMVLDSRLSRNDKSFFKILINQKDKEGKNTLMIAISKDKTEIVKAFLEKGISTTFDFNDQINYWMRRNQATELIKKAHSNAKKIITSINNNSFNNIESLGISQEEAKMAINIPVLIEKAFENPTPVNFFAFKKEYLTPLQFSASKGNVEAIEKLIDLGANINSTNQQNRTALHYAYKYNKPTAINLLIQKGINNEIIDYKNKMAEEYGRNPSTSPSNNWFIQMRPNRNNENCR